MKHDVFVSSGFKNWKNALNVFHKQETRSHKDCVVSWKGYKARAVEGNVVQQTEATNGDEIEGVHMMCFDHFKDVNNKCVGMLLCMSGPESFHWCHF